MAWRKNMDMFNAARDGNIERVKRLAERGSLVGFTGFYNWTLLHYASFYGWTEILRTILQNGAVGVNAKSSDMRTPLMLALQNGNQDIAEALVGAGAEFRSCDNEKKNILHYACSSLCYSEEGLAKIVNHIIERGETDLHAKSMYGWTPLLHAVNTEKVDIAEILIQAGVDASTDPLPNTKLSVLHHCIRMGWTKLVWMIVEKWGWDLKPTSGPIPLHLACISRNIETIMLLIVSGANVNFKNDSNESALCYLLTHGEVELIRLLVQHGAYFGESELQFLSRNLELSELLFKDGHLRTQFLINRFNNYTLPIVYNVPDFRDALPQIGMVTINNDKSTAAREIANFVNQTKKISNAFKGRLIVLKLICVKWLIEYLPTP